MRSLLCSLLLTLPAFAADPPVSPIDLPKIVTVVPQPMPLSPDAGVPLSEGQWYVVIGSSKLVLSQVSLGGEVSIAASKKTTLTLPAAWVVGRKPDVDDPEFCTITGKFLYVVKAKVVGKTVLLVDPTLNAVDAKGVPIPFVASDFVQVVIDVKGGKPPVDPVTPLTPFQTKLKAAISTDSATPEQLGNYASFYRLVSQNNVQDEFLKTSGDLTKEMLAVLEAMKLPKGSLATTARTIADELNTILPRPANTPLGMKNSTVRNLYATTYARIAADLETAGAK